MNRLSVPYLPGSVLRNIYALVMFTVLLLTVPTRQSCAQDNTMYLMPGIPQANQLNPALFIPCRIYVELPVISSVKVNLRNSGFGFHDVVHTGTGAQSDTYSFDLTNLDKKLKRNNHFQTQTDINLLGFGFGFKGWYFTFGIANHSDLLLSYPHDVSSLKDGNWQVANGKAIPINLDHLEINATLWNSIGISAARELMDGLKAGVRLKYIQGMANIKTSRSDFQLNTTSNPITLEAQMMYRINSSFPVKPAYSANGVVKSLNFDNTLSNIPGDFIFNGNRGVAIDGGIVYDIDEKTQVTASFIDLGFIHWKKNINNFTASGNFIFNGVNLDSLQANPGQTDLIKALKDSISGAFSGTGTSNAYFTLLPVKIFGGVTRAIRPYLRAGAMARIEIYNLQAMPSLTFSMNYIPVPAVAASISYTIMNNKFNQVGAGLALGNKGVQFYIVTDNIVGRFTKDTGTGLIWPYNARMISLRVGLNLIFGCNEKEKKPAGKNYRRKDVCPAYW
jgi:hypothetical protein